jgi:hypothetical protein
MPSRDEPGAESKSAGRRFESDRRYKELAPFGDPRGSFFHPLCFAQEVRRVEVSGGAYQLMREAWVHLVFPDAFENISSRKDKRLIREAFTRRRGFLQGRRTWAERRL